MDIQGQINYWLSSSGDSLEAARILIQKGKCLEGLFFAHLAVEKTLKAHVVKQTQQIPPRTHNLRRLASVARLPLSDDLIDFLVKITLYQLEGRYPTETDFKPTQEFAQEMLKKTAELVSWLRELL